MSARWTSEVVLTVHVGHDGFQAGEPGKRKHFPQSVDLNHGLHAIKTGVVAPNRLREPASMEVGVHRHIVAKAFRNP